MKSQELFIVTHKKIPAERVRTGILLISW